MKRFLSVCLLLVLLLSLVACKGQDSEKETIGTAEKVDRMFGQQPEEPQDGDEEQPEEPDEKDEETAISTNLEDSPYLIAAKNPGETLYGFVDVRTGEYAIEPAFTYTDDAFGDDGWAKVQVEEQWTVINTQGQTLFEPGSIEHVVEYEDDCIVAKVDETTMHLYHGAEFVCQLEIPVEDYVSASLGRTIYGSGNRGGSYTPDRFILISTENEQEEETFVWYDADGNVILVTEHNGALAADETGYYYLRGSYLDIYDLDGNLVETKEHGEAAQERVRWDGDNWYMVVNLEDGHYSEVYTNGLTMIYQNGAGTGYAFLHAASGVILTPDGSYIKPDGQVFYSSSGLVDGFYGFKNGYCKVDMGAPGNVSGDYSGYIDTDGNEVFEFENGIENYTSVFKGGYIGYRENDLWGIMNLDGSIVVEPKYGSFYGN